MPVLIVTTPHKPKEAAVRRAEAVAKEIHGVYAARESLSLTKLFERRKADHLIVVSEKGLEWHIREGAPFMFHPGMSVVRAKRLDRGEKDPMLEAAAFHPGDSVLDCTAGLASDAVFFAYAGGMGSRITALESEFPLYYVVSRGLQEYHAEQDALTAAMRRVELLYREHTEYLSLLPDRSVDIVYFDPMFRAPVQESAGISQLRSMANDQTLQPEAVREAVRVARKAVVLKERRDGKEFSRLGFTVLKESYSQVAYGVIRI